MIPFIDNPDDESRLLLAFRDMGKTTIVIRKIIQLVLINPNERILYVSEKKDRAIEVTSTIRHILQNNQYLTWAFPDILWGDPNRKKLFDPTMRGETPHKWAPNKFTVKRTINVPDATVTAGTLSPMPTGGHYTRIFCDDLEIPENTMTHEALERTKVQFGYFYTMLSSSVSDVSTEGPVFVSGTMYDDNDLHSDLLKDEDFKSQIISAYLTEDVAEKMGVEYLGPETTLTCPKRCHEKWLRKRKSKMPEMIFRCQYLQDPYDEKTSLYKLSDLQQRYKKIPENCVFATIVDPAGEEETVTGESAVLSVGIDEKENIYFRFGNRGNFDSPTFCHAILMHRKMCKLMYGRPSEIGVEKAALQAAYKSILEQITDEAFVVKDLRHGSKNWFMRAFPMATRCQHNKFWFPDKELYPEEQWWVDALIRQLTKSRRSKKKGQKDWWDCVAYIDQMIVDHNVRAPMTGEKAYTGTDGAEIADPYIGY